MLNALLSVLLLAAVCLQGQARQMTPAQMRARQHLAAEARHTTLLDLAPGPINLAASHAQKRASGPKNITFSNPKASGRYSTALQVVVAQLSPGHGLEFFVDGKNIPQVSFDVGPSWAGLLPISGNANETRKVRMFSLMCRKQRLTRVLP